MISDSGIAGEVEEYEQWAERRAMNWIDRSREVFSSKEAILYLTQPASMSQPKLRWLSSS